MLRSCIHGTKRLCRLRGKAVCVRVIRRTSTRIKCEVLTPQPTVGTPAGVRVEVTNRFVDSEKPTPAAGTTFNFASSSPNTPFLQFVAPGVNKPGTLEVLPQSISGKNPVIIRNADNVTITSLFAENPSGEPLTLSVDRPQVEIGKVELGTPGIYHYNNIPWLSSANADQNEFGMRVVYNKLNESPFKGEFAVIQIIRTETVYTKNDGKVLQLSSGKDFVLDCSPSQTSAFYRNKIVDTMKSNDKFFVMDDTPRSNLSDDDKDVAVDEAFTTYFMFKSGASQDANWVPLSQFSWGWQAQAVRDGSGKWKTNEEPLIWATIPQSFKRFPEWTRSVKDLKLEPIVVI